MMDGMDESRALVKAQQGQGISILDAPVDERYLLGEWNRARERFLLTVLIKDGTEDPKANTRNAYEIALEQFFDGMVSEQDGRTIWPAVAPWTVIRAQVLQWKQIMSVAGKAVRDGHGREVGRAALKASTIGLKMSALKAFYDFVQYSYEIAYNPPQHEPYLDLRMLFLSENGRAAVLWPADWRNPFDPKAIRRPYVERLGRRPGMSPQEVAAILGQINTSCLRGKRDMAILLALFSTGCRYEEILERKWGDLREKEDGNFVIGFQGKNGKWNEVELKRRVYMVIGEYLRADGRLEVMQAGDFIFTALDPGRIRRLHPEAEIDANRPLSNSQVNKMLKSYARRAEVDLEKAHCHGLRSARAEQIMEASDRETGQPDLVEVQRQLRHGSVATSRSYVDGFMKRKALHDRYGDAAIDEVLPKGEKRRKKKVAGEQERLL